MKTEKRFSEIEKRLEALEARFKPFTEDGVEYVPCLTFVPKDEFQRDAPTTHAES